jgi:uncharacterized protein (DUF433 family)
MQSLTLSDLFRVECVIVQKKEYAPMPTDHPYVEERNNTYYVRGQRVRLISLAQDWNNGASPESIAEHFSVLKLSEVYGAIAYYLDHKQELDAHFAVLMQQESALESEALAHHDQKSRELHQRFEALRTHREASAS